MSVEAPSRNDSSGGDPPGPRLWLSLAAVIIIAAALQSYGIRSWPMADDEVLSLVQLGMYHVDPAAFSFPPNHLGKLPKAVPVWTAVQGGALSLVPHTEAGFRIPSVICGVLASAAAFVFAARWRGLPFAVSLAIIVNASPLFVHVAQVNRFYSLPLLLVIVTLGVIWMPRGGFVPVLLAAVLGLLSVFSHNVTVAVFGLAFAASCAVYLIGAAPLPVVMRSGAACFATALAYAAYLRPLIRGWSTTGNPTPVLVSFVAHAGVPTVALALVGGWLAVARRDGREPLLWWTLMVLGTVVLFLLSTFSWNPRYFVFFLPPLWFLAAHATDVIGRRLGGLAAAAWYAGVAILLLPNLLSHFQDGSRHDYRAAADVLIASDPGHGPILSDDAETITYYLPEELRRRLVVRTKVRVPPASEFFLVQRANAWMPIPRYPGRQVDVLAEISHRRYDQFSHIVRVFRVGPRVQPPNGRGAAAP